MRIIPIDNNTTLIVLKEITMSESMNLDGDKNDLICLTSNNEIVLYRERMYEISVLKIENVNLEIERSELRPGNEWRSIRRQDIHNKYFKDVKSIMLGYIREKKIDDLLKTEDKNENIWC